MKKVEIGMCRDCKWWKKRGKEDDNEFGFFGLCDYSGHHDTPVYPYEYFGCNQWEEKEDGN